jgi:hypothetical protein
VGVIIVSVVFFVVFVAIVPNYIYQTCKSILKDAVKISSEIFDISRNNHRQHYIDNLTARLVKTNTSWIMYVLQNQKIRITRQGRKYKIISTYRLGLFSTTCEHYSRLEGEQGAEMDTLIEIVNRFSIHTTDVIAQCTAKPKIVHIEHVHQPAIEKV